MASDENQALASKQETYGTEAAGAKETSWLETARVLFSSGAGLLADGYDLSVVNLAIALMSELYPDSMDGFGQSVAVSSTMAGIIIGMVSFGGLADFWGRKYASMTTAFLTMIGALLSACVADHAQLGIAVQLAFCRFFLGLGIGGEYPLSAALGSEASFSKNLSLACSRSQLLVANMLFMNTGYVLQALVFLILLSSTSLDMVWRIAFACGSLPSMVVLILRAWMPEPTVTERRSLNNLMSGLTAEMQSKYKFLVSVCLCWGLFNIVSYSLMSFSHVICEEIFPSSEKPLETVVRRDAVFAMALSFVGCLTYVCLFVKINQEPNMKKLQLLSFIAASALLVLAATLVPTKYISAQAGAYVMITVSMSLLGASTYLLPTEGFPATIRGTIVGLAAASGKVGALLGTALFPLAIEKVGLAIVLLASSAVMFLGAGVTFIATPDNYQSTKTRDKTAD